MPTWYQRLCAWDNRLHRVETFTVLILTCVMVGSVFLAVLWQATNSVRAHSDPWWGIAALLGFPAVLGFMNGGETMLRKVLFAVATATATGVALLLLVWLAPNGLMFSQRLALSLMLWSMMLGISMATHRRSHLKVKALQGLIRSDLRVPHALLGLSATLLCTLWLTWIGLDYTWNSASRWLFAQGTSGVYASISIPIWTVAASIPVGFGLTSLRLFHQIVGIWIGDQTVLEEGEETTS